MWPIAMVLAALALHDAQGSAGCAQDFSQCNGLNWPYSVCCLNNGFVCTHVNDDLSLCLATPVQSTHVAGNDVGDGLRQRRLRRNAAQSEATGATGAGALASQEATDEPNRPVAYLGQCGGLGYSGPTICTHGLFCHVESPYYSSCLFNPTDDAHVGVWRKCGGANWSGQTRCQEGSTCQVQTVWYSQCVPLV